MSGLTLPRCFSFCHGFPYKAQQDPWSTGCVTGFCCDYGIIANESQFRGKGRGRSPFKLSPLFPNICCSRLLPAGAHTCAGYISMLVFCHSLPEGPASQKGSGQAWEPGLEETFSTQHSPANLYKQTWCVSETDNLTETCLEQVALCHGRAWPRAQTLTCWSEDSLPLRLANSSGSHRALSDQGGWRSARAFCGTAPCIPHSQMEPMLTCLSEKISGKSWAIP